tara:strand:- start:204 stop:590 length:387 start_codon:yes stop_codon:yes gene_type:complete
MINFQITQRDIIDYNATNDKLSFVCDLCNVMVSEYDNDDGKHGDVQAFVDGVEAELIRRAPTNKLLFADVPHMTKRLAEVNRAGIAAAATDTGAINAARDFGLTLKGTNEEGLEFQTFVDAFFNARGE